MQINVTSYKDIREASLRLKDGSFTALNSVSPYLYAAEFRAANTPGEHRVTLVLDGQDYSYQVALKKFHLFKAERSEKTKLPSCCNGFPSRCFFSGVESNEGNLVSEYIYNVLDITAQTQSSAPK